jgi:hypothetical protein
MQTGAFVKPSKRTDWAYHRPTERDTWATGINPAELSVIFHMTQRGLFLEQISQESDVAIEVLKLFLPEVIQETVETQIDADQGPCEVSQLLGVSEIAVLPYTLDCRTYSPPTTTEETKHPQPTKPHHTFLYSCQKNANQLHRVNLFTGEKTSHEVPHYQFKYGCCWIEVPGGSLLITGGGSYPGLREVVKIDTLREYAVSSQPPMHTARYSHAAVYHSQSVYVLGRSECERYSCAESRWEVLPALPRLRLEEKSNVCCYQTGSGAGCYS